MGIRVEGVGKTSGQHAVLADVSLTIDDGAFVVVLGPTGSGKTSLLRILAGIDRPDGGRVFYDDVDVTRMPIQKRSVAMVYQQFVNYPSLTLYENIASPLRLRRPRLSRSEIEVRVHEISELLGLREVLSHRPSEVSGGQQQRTAIARSLAKGAKYFFLDEPLTNLDLKLREELRGELKKIFSELGGAAVYATPDPVDALSMSTHVGVLQNGRLVQYGPTREVYYAPINASAGEYFSYPTMNIVRARVDRSRDSMSLRVSDELCIEHPALKDVLSRDEYDVGIRAHALKLTKGSTSAASFRATVDFMEVVGSDTEIYVTHGDVHLTVLTENVLKLDRGDELQLYLDPGDLYVFDCETRDLVLGTRTGNEGL